LVTEAYSKEKDKRDYDLKVKGQTDLERWRNRQGKEKIPKEVKKAKIGIPGSLRYDKDGNPLTQEHYNEILDKVVQPVLTNLRDEGYVPTTEKALRESLSTSRDLLGISPEDRQAALFPIVKFYFPNALPVNEKASINEAERKSQTANEGITGWGPEIKSIPASIRDVLPSGPTDILNMLAQPDPRFGVGNISDRMGVGLSGPVGDAIRGVATRGEYQPPPSMQSDFNIPTSGDIDMNGNPNNGETFEQMMKRLGRR
jgi:hypothetical protein